MFSSHDLVAAAKEPELRFRKRAYVGFVAFLLIVIGVVAITSTPSRGNGSEDIFLFPRTLTFFQKDGDETEASPTMMPTTMTTMMPTVMPTMMPTAMPTTRSRHRSQHHGWHRTMMPTMMPTKMPTVRATIVLTIIPTVTPVVSTLTECADRCNVCEDACRSVGSCAELRACGSIQFPGCQS
jgi:hypothetical protein